jgi:hypothetical protein
MLAAPAQPSTITATGGNTKVCPGDSKTYSIPSVAGATSYTWTPPPGGTIVSGQGTVSVTVSFTANFIASDSLKVVAVNACGNSPVRFIKINRNNPARPSVISGPLTGVCNASGVSYSVINVPGITYNWYFGATGASVTSGQGTSAITAAFTSAYTTGPLNVTASNACGTSALRTSTVRSTLAPPTGLSGPTSVCANQQAVPYSCNPLTGATSYTWSAPSGARIFDGTVLSTSNTLTTTATSVTVNFAVTAGNVRVKGNNSCGAGTNATLAVAITCREVQPVSFNLLNTDAYPNPAGDELHVSFFSELTSTYRFRIIDLTGKVLLVSTGDAAAGENEIMVDVANIAPGIYFAETVCNGKTGIIRIAIQ